MESSKLNLFGYHGTCSKFKDSIENKGLDPNEVKCRDDHWLGHGVYYFEEFSQAKWWAYNISRQEDNKGSYSLIYKSMIEADYDEVLNLDNNIDVDKFMSYIIVHLSEIEKDDKNRLPIFTEDTLRAVYFDYYRIQNNISVIIHTFTKNAVKYCSIRKPKELEKQKKLVKRLNIPYKEKQICVSKKDCIKNTEIVYNEEEEVI